MGQGTVYLQPTLGRGAPQAVESPPPAFLASTAPEQPDAAPVPARDSYNEPNTPTRVPMASTAFIFVQFVHDQN